MTFERPPCETNPDGAPRHVGVEIELAGLDVDETARLVQATLGGRVRVDGPFVRTVEGTDLGPMRIELDAAALESEGLKNALGEVERRLDALDLDGAAARENLEAGISRVAGTLVPCEIVTAPLGFEQLDALQDLLHRLREAGARGTHAAPHYAFGVHFNPEVPTFEPERLHAYLQAFVLRYRWLLEQGQVDPVRRLTPFIDPYPAAYVRHLLEASPPTSLAALIDAYLEHSPTRNRALDMLPLFSHLDDDRVRAVVDDPRIKARPTFHYRLSSCRVDEPDWALSDEWNRWVEVERLAEDPERLRAARAEALDEPRPPELLDRVASI